MEREETVPFCIRYDTVKVKADLDKEIICISKEHLTWGDNSDKIYLPLSTLNTTGGYEFVAHNTGEKRHINYKGYIVDLIEEGEGWKYYYPMEYKNDGIFYKIRSDDYYKKDLFPDLSDVNNLNEDCLVMVLFDKQKEKGIVIKKEKAPDDLIRKKRNKTIPSTLSGEEIIIYVDTFHITDSEGTIEVPASKWKDWINEYDEAIAEGTIGEFPCYIDLRHLKQIL